MSGICAIWNKENPSRAAGMLEAVSNGLAIDRVEVRRLERDGAAGVGVSAQFGTQQVYQDSRVLVACDADLLNERELRTVVGDVRVGGTGTPALLAALHEKLGSAFIEKLRGSFSLILWDKREQRWLAAVDGFGVKRLVYYEDSKIFAIGSRIEAVLQCGEIDRGINPRAIANVLNFSANLGPETVFDHIRRLSPGSLLHASKSGVRIEAYWNMRYFSGGSVDEETMRQEMASVVHDSITANCRNLPAEGVGAFLSGGTDSSTVVGSMARGGITPVNAFSIGFAEAEFDEMEYARLAAKKFGAEHYTYSVTAKDCLEALPKMVRHFEEPFGNSSAIPTYFCAKLAAENGVNVLLAGDGGDELFGGNSWYATDQVFEAYQRVPAILRKGVVEPVLRVLPMETGIVRRAKSYVRKSNLPRMERLMSFQFLCAHDSAEIFDSSFLEALDGYSVLEIPLRYYDEAPASAALDKVLYSDVKIILGDSDLPKVTTMAEAAGVHVRFPYLDRSVAEFSGRMPDSFKVRGGEKRYLFKRAFQDLLPVEILKKKKHGFGIPVSTWLKTDSRMRDLAHDALLSSRSAQRGYFKREFMEDLMRKHQADDTAYYGDTVWTFLALELWHRQFVDQQVSVSV